jgi:hypothetical protein
MADSTCYKPIAGTMWCDWFCKLRNYLHVNNNDNKVPREHKVYDKLFKIRLFMESLRKKFLQIEPQGNNSVDEMMIPLKSHTSMLQYVKSNPHRWGVKVFTRGGVSAIVFWDLCRQGGKCEWWSFRYKQCGNESSGWFAETSVSQVICYVEISLFRND